MVHDGAITIFIHRRHKRLDVDVEVEVEDRLAKGVQLDLTGAVLAPTEEHKGVKGHLIAHASRRALCLHHNSVVEQLLKRQHGHRQL
jgi:hypothetical protein